MEANFGPLEKALKTTDIIRDKIFLEKTFLTTKGIKKFSRNWN